MVNNVKQIVSTELFHQLYTADGYAATPNWGLAEALRGQQGRDPQL